MYRDFFIDVLLYLELENHTFKDQYEARIICYLLGIGESVSKGSFNSEGVIADYDRRI
jgi:hypothetical protein